MMQRLHTSLKTPFWLVFFLCCSVINSHAQSLDSFIENYRRLPEADIEKRANALVELINAQINISEDSLFARIDLAAELYKKLGNESKYQEINLEKRGLASSVFGYRTEALKLYLKYADYLRKEKRENENGYFYVDIGNIYYNFRLYQSALKHYQKAEYIFKNQKNTDGIATIYSNYSLVAHDQKQVDTAAHYAQLAFEIKIKQNKDAWDIAYQNHVLAGSYEAAQKWDLAKKHYLKALDLMQEPEKLPTEKYGAMIMYIPTIAIKVAYRYLLNEQIDSAIYFLNHAKTTSQKYNVTEAMINGINILEMNILAAQGDYPMALKMGEKCIRDINNIKGKRDIVIKTTARTYKDLEKIARKFKDKPRQYEFYYWWQVYKDSVEQIRSQDQMLAINALVLEMENEQTIQNQKIEISEQEQQTNQERQARQVLTFVVAAAVFFLLLMAALWWWVRRKNRLIQAYSAELETANATKEMLISIISHDLRNPFNTLIGLSQTRATQTATELLHRLQSVNETARQTHNLLDNLLRWLGLQKKNMSVVPSVFSLDKWLGSFLPTYEQSARLKNIEIKRESVFPSIKTDADMLQVVLRNILSNAIRHSPINTQIRLSSQQQNGFCCLRIADQGGGLPIEILEKLQQKNIKAQEFGRKGSGLGLFLVFSFLQQLNLAYKVYNEHAGAVFELYIPLAENQEKPDATDVVAPKNNTQELRLSPNEKAILLPFLAQLEALELFETTMLYKILQQVPDQSAALSEWKSEVKNAIQYANQQAFDILIENAKN